MVGMISAVDTNDIEKPAMVSSTRTKERINEPRLIGDKRTPTDSDPVVYCHVCTVQDQRDENGNIITEMIQITEDLITGEVREQTLGATTGITTRPKRATRASHRSEEEGYPQPKNVESGLESNETNKQPATKQPRKKKTDAEKIAETAIKLKAKEDKIKAAKLQAKQDRAQKILDRKRAQKAATIERLGRINIQQPTTIEYVEETEEEEIKRENGQRKIAALQHLQGRHFIHDGILFEIVFLSGINKPTK